MRLFRHFTTPAKTRRCNPQGGSALVVAMSTMGVLAVTATLMMGKYFQSAKSIRNTGAKVEANALFSQIQQSVGNQNICSSAFNAYQFQNVQTGHVPSPVTLPNLNATVNGSALPIAYPGMISNGISIAPSTGPNPALQLTGGPNYTFYGTQMAGLSTYQGLNCALVNLHVNASKERSNVSNAQRRTLGLETMGEDFPLTIFTDPVTNQIQNCFGGEPLPGACIQAAPATMNTFSPVASCDTPGLVSFNWTATNAIYIQISCTPTVAAPNFTASPATLDMSGILPGTIVTCSATAYNSAYIPSATSLSTTVHVEHTCNPPVLAISTTPNACVDTGQAYTVTWSDDDQDPNGIETLTGPGIAGTFSPPITPGASSGSLTAPAAPTTLTYTINDSNFVAPPPGVSASATLQVKAPPVFTTPLSGTNQIFKSTPITFSYATANVTGGVSYKDPVSNAVIPGRPLNGPDVVTAPSAQGFYNYVYSLSGGCPADADVTASSLIQVCDCDPAKQALVPYAPPPGNPSPDTCNISRAQCPGTRCDCIPTDQNNTYVGNNTNNTCGNPDPSCPGLRVDGACGSAYGVPTISAPSVGLCGSPATPSTPIVSGTNWAWNCPGSGNGNSQPCTAPKLSAQDGACGVGLGASLNAPTAGLCTYTGAATTTAVRSGSNWTWDCTGSNGGHDAGGCSVPVVDCGIATAMPTGTQPTSNLCSPGSTSSPAVLDGSSSNWIWSCSGSDYPASKSCSVANVGCTNGAPQVATGGHVQALCSPPAATIGPHWLVKCNKIHNYDLNSCWSTIQDNDYQTEGTIYCNNFQLGIPSNATILGATIDFAVASGGGQGVGGDDIQSIGFVQGTSPIGNQVTFSPNLHFWTHQAELYYSCIDSNCTSSSSSIAARSSSSMWGLALTPAMLNDPNFGYFVSMYKEVDTMFFFNSADAAKIQVTYTVPSVVSGACGSADKSSRTDQPSNADACLSGTVTGMTLGSNNYYSWNCNDTCGGTGSASCSEDPGSGGLPSGQVCDIWQEGAGSSFDCSSTLFDDSLCTTCSNGYSDTTQNSTNCIYHTVTCN